MKIVKYIFLYMWILFITLACFSTRWALLTFANLSFDEVIFQLTTPVGSAGSTVLLSFVFNSLFWAILISFIILLGVIVVNKKLEIKRKYNLIILIIMFVVSILILFFCLYKIGFVDYFKNINSESSFIEDNYVNPKDVNIEFPVDKKNLIYIYVESLESNFYNEGYLEPLKDITDNNINFSDTDKVGGAISAPGTTWTTGAMVAHTSGLPLKVDFKTNTISKEVITLGDILNREGYNQMLMIGSDKDFGLRGDYFKNNGNYNVYDYNTAIEKNKISKDYYKWWGVEDKKLYKYAKEEITELAKSNRPFNFTMLTANTHFPGGYIDNNCPKRFNNHYKNSIYCSALELKEFIEWAEKQDFYNNTSIVVVGDHISMQMGLYPKNTKRRIFNLFINSSLTEGNFKNRKFNTMDFFPTTLGSLGVNIEGDRLGLGTNLFSDKKTLMEEVGVEIFKSEIAKHSNYYSNNTNIKIGTKLIDSLKRKTTEGLFVNSKVTIKYNANGGVLHKHHGNSYSIKKGFIYKDGKLDFHKIENSKRDDLYNYNNIFVINLKKDGYYIKPGEEWNTKRDGSGKSYSQSDVYNSKEFCDASKKDCTVTLYANWKKKEYYLTIKYNLNGGSITAQEVSNYNSNKIKINEDIKLLDFDSEEFKITRDGYAVSSDISWNTKKDGSGKSYSQTDIYKSKDFCDIKKKNCTITLYANWKKTFNLATFNMGYFSCGSSKFKCSPTEEDFTNLIKNNKIDIIGLQEAKTSVYLLSKKAKEKSDKSIINIGKKSGLKYNYITSPSNVNAILSRYKFKSRKTVKLSICHERRALSKTIININGVDISYYNTHFSYQDDCPKVHMENVVEVLKKDSNPIILTGDFNKVSDENYKQYLEPLGFIVAANDTKYHRQDGKNSYMDSVFILPKKHIEVVDSKTIATYRKYSDHNLVVATMFTK